MRLAMLGFGVLFFIYIGWRLTDMADRLKQPPEPEPVWSAQLTKAARKISKSHPEQLVSAVDAYRFFERGEGTFIDVRSPDEQAVSRIPGALVVEPGSLDPDREPWKSLIDSPIFVYCTVGARSGDLKDEMRKLGWPAFNILGGICAWTWAGGPLVDGEGRPTKQVHTWSRDFSGCVSPDHTAIWK